MEAVHYREMLDITFSTRMIFSHYEKMRARFTRFISGPPKMPEKPADMTLKADSNEAKEVIFNLFRTIKKGCGYST